MAQWNRNRNADIASGYDERAIAQCTPADVDLLVNHDHQVVQIHGRRGVLITYHLQGPQDPSTAPRVQVSFAHPEGHPDAPSAVQALVDSLVFRRWDGSPRSAL